LKGVLPVYLTGNKNWNNISTLQGYRNLYQSSENEYAAASSRPGAYILGGIGLAFTLSPAGRTAEAIGAAFVGGIEASLSLSNLKDATAADVAAIDARIDQLRSGC